MATETGAASGLGGRLAELRTRPRRWLVTGSAGFIGSHLVEALLRLEQIVVGIDNFATGRRGNLDDVRAAVGDDAWQRHTLHEDDLVDPAACARACQAVDVVLHHAAIGSVPHSLAAPQRTHDVNATGFLNLLAAAREAGVSRFVYASSSSVYGDGQALPNVEHALGRPLSPYAVTKRIGELYADVFARCYGMTTIGLRYFNVFGPRQDSDSAYAAVVPRWIAAMTAGRTVTIFGDGETSRDFCYVANIVQANLLAATTLRAEAVNQVYNVGTGIRHSLNELFGILRGLVEASRPDVAIAADHQPLRPGDMRHSQADIAKARRLLGYEPTHDLRAGLRETLAWHEGRAAR